MQTAFLKDSVQLLGTSLRISKGIVVECHEATNLPKTKEPQFFIRPFMGHWEDKIERSPDDSILVGQSELDFIPIRD